MPRSKSHAASRQALTVREKADAIIIRSPWWQVQPDVQYRWLPGGGAANPGQPGKRLGNELIMGLRSTMTF